MQKSNAVAESQLATIPDRGRGREERRHRRGGGKPPGTAFDRLVTGIADNYPPMLIPLMRLT